MKYHVVHSHRYQRRQAGGGDSAVVIPRLHYASYSVISPGSIPSRAANMRHMHNVQYKHNTYWKGGIDSADSVSTHDI